MYRFLFLFVFSFRLLYAGNASEKDSLEHHGYIDSLNLAQHFSRGHVKGHLRNFFMSTVNQGELKDYWTNAYGMSLHYESIPFYGFVFEMKGIFSFQTLSSDLNERDELTQKGSKWEVELYDVLDSYNTHDLDRLEELFIEYRWKESHIKYGRIAIDDTPLINESDGRMKPFVFKGFNAHLKLKNHFTIQPFLLNGVSPRSTVEWFTINEAMGIKNNGYDANGDSANYRHHIEARYIGGLGLMYDLPNVKVRLWEFILDKTYNTNWLQLDADVKKINFGLITAYQFGLASQESLEFNNQYIHNNSKVGIVSGKLGYDNRTFSFDLSHTEIFGAGRFLNPREFGRDQFYTSVTRSRADGLGKASVSKLGATYSPQKLKQLLIDCNIQYTNAAGEYNYAYNKYGVRDFIQYLLNFDYQFSEKLKGLEATLLYVYRQDVDSGLLSKERTINQTNFHQINVIVNINF